MPLQAAAGPTGPVVTAAVGVAVRAAAAVAVTALQLHCIAWWVLQTAWYGLGCVEVLGWVGATVFVHPAQQQGVVQHIHHQAATLAAGRGTKGKMFCNMYVAVLDKYRTCCQHSLRMRLPEIREHWCCGVGSVVSEPSPSGTMVPPVRATAGR